MGNEYEVLGEQVLREVSGDGGAFSSSGFSPDFLIDAASEIAKRGVDTYQAQQQSDKQKQATKDAVNRAIAADKNWANALALLDIANQSRDPSRIAPAQTLAHSAEMSASSAGGSLTGEAQTLRTQAAQKSLDQAAQASMAAPSDTLKSAQMRAWQQVLSAAQMGGSAAHGGSGGALSHARGGAGNFLTKVHGGLPTWGWGVVGVTGIAGITLLVKAIRR